jgi:peptidoglycan/LPS O-acetylase OafA/YrhL
MMDPRSLDLEHWGHLELGDRAQWEFMADLKSIKGYLEPRQGGRFAALDGCRALAALAVVLYHVAGWAYLPNTDTLLGRFQYNLGSYGVAVFFLLSGFLLYRPFVMTWFRDEDPPDPFHFLRRRVVRIFPAYIVALTAFFALGLAGQARVHPDYYFTLYSLTQIYRATYSMAGLSVAWSLCVEMSFYLVLPLIAAAIRLIGRRARTLRAKLEAQLLGLAALVIICFIYRALVAVRVTAPTVPQVDLWLPNYLDKFALGMLLAVCVCWTDMRRRLPALVQRLANSGALCWSLAGLCYITLMVSPVDASGTGLVPNGTGVIFVRYGMNGLGAFFLLLPLVLGERQDSPIRRGLTWLVPMYLGTISYGIYLWHPIWLGLLGNPNHVGANWSFWPMLVAVLSLTILSASASYYLIERPAMALREPRARQRRPSPDLGRART